MRFAVFCKEAPALARSTFVIVTPCWRNCATLSHRIPMNDLSCQLPCGLLLNSFCITCSSSVNCFRSGATVCAVLNFAALAVLEIVLKLTWKPYALRFSRSRNITQFPGPGASFLIAISIQILYNDWHLAELSDKLKDRYNEGVEC